MQRRLCIYTVLYRICNISLWSIFLISMCAEVRACNCSCSNQQYYNLVHHIGWNNETSTSTSNCRLSRDQRSGHALLIMSAFLCSIFITWLGVAVQMLSCKCLYFSKDIMITYCQTTNVRHYDHLLSNTNAKLMNRVVIDILIIIVLVRLHCFIHVCS